MSLATPSAAHADGYRYSEMGYAWQNVSAMTLCVYAGSPQADYHALPPSFLNPLKGAISIWNDSPGPVAITFNGNCTKRTPADVVVVAKTEPGKTHRDGQQSEVWAGTGGCASVADRRDKVWPDYMCPRQSGLITVNDWYKTDTDGRSLYWHYVFVHEIGHVLGLNHPMRNGCNGEDYTCVGPVMSYGTCPSANGGGCKSVTPNEDDRAGLRKIYYGNSSASASGCTAALADTLNTDPVELVSRAAMSVGTVTGTGGPGDTVGKVLATTVTPNLLALTVPLPSVSGPILVPTASAPFVSLENATAIVGVLDMIASEPAVDAFASLQASAGKGWKTVELVLDDAGIPSPAKNCL